MIKEEGGVVAAYAWSAASATWERLGEVTGVSGDGSGKKTYGGKEYDYVFDVDFKDGAPPLKLPFDNGDNPYDAAETFLETSGLPMEYREQVVNFIVQNVGAENVTQVSLFYSRVGNLTDVVFCVQGANVDPFTGSGAYVPGGAAPGGASGGAPGGGSYDPFTGGGAYVPSAAPTPGTSSNAAPAFKFLPMKTPLAFEAAKFDGILKKLSEFGAEDGAMGEVAAACNGGDPPGAASVATLVTYLNTWPVDKLFPLLDVCRMVALRGEAAGVSAELAAAAAAACARSVAETPRLPANLLTAGRLFCNAFKHAGLRDAFLLHASQILVSDDEEPLPLLLPAFAYLVFVIRLAVRSFLGPRFNHRGARFCRTARSNHTAPPVPSPYPARTIRRRGDM